MMTSPSLRAQETYPVKPVRIFVGHSAGTLADVAGRTMAETLLSHHANAVVINKPSAGGILAIQEVKKAEADGYTLYVGVPSNLHMTPHLYKEPGFDTLKDFAPVFNLGFVPQALVVNPAVPAASLAELISISRARPERLNFTTAGVRNFSHVMVEVMNKVARAGFFLIPQKNPAMAIADVVENRSQVFVESIGFLEPFIKAGKVRLLAFNGTERLATYPDVPTMGETVPELNVGGRVMLVTPAGTPEFIQGWLNNALNEDGELKAKVAKFQFVGGGGNLKTIRQYFVEDHEAWQRVLELADLPKE